MRSGSPRTSAAARCSYPRSPASSARSASFSHDRSSTTSTPATSTPVLSTRPRSHAPSTSSRRALPRRSTAGASSGSAAQTSATAGGAGGGRAGWPGGPTTRPPPPGGGPSGGSACADEMATTIFRTAHSTVVRDGMDFSAAICDPNGETVAQGVTVPFHLGSVPHAMKTLLAKFGDELLPGDVFVMNDPFDGGIHLQDIFVFKPVFSAERLIGFATTTAHHGDVGGRLPGSSACDNTEILPEGIRLPSLRLFDRAHPVEGI